MTRKILIFLLIAITIVHGESILEQEKYKKLQDKIVRELLVSTKCDCKNICVNGICEKINKNYKCVCNEGWKGPRCDQKKGR